MKGELLPLSSKVYLFFIYRFTLQSYSVIINMKDKTNKSKGEMNNERNYF